MKYYEFFTFFLPDFINLQRNSFYYFLETGIIQEFSKRNPIINSNKTLELIFYPEYYKLNPPEWNPKEAILKSKTYACRLYIPAQLTNHQTKEIKLQWVLLGNLPLMTKRGHFIINGSPRVIVNQMIRSPGIYYQETLDKKKKRTYFADLISYRGAWLRLETDKKKRIWARMKKTPKISILVFLQSLGLSKESIFQSIFYSDFLKYSFLKENHPLTTKEALITLYSKTHPKKDKTEITPDLGQKFLFRKFLNSKTYDLGFLGRLRLNKKLSLSVPLNECTLTPQDFLYATDYLIKLEYGNGILDDIDNLKNRRVRASGELIQNQISTGLIRLEKMIREKLKKPKKKLSIKSLITTKPINGSLREFFGSSQLSQFMDQTNPLSEITHKRRVTSLGPGGISRETAGMAVRGIHPTHYGRICPIETPEGQNAGLVNSIATYARMDLNGFLETPFYEVYEGQIQNNKKPIYFSAEHEEKVIIAPGDLNKSKLNFLSKNLIPVRSFNEFKRVYKNHIQYIGLSPIQMISIATSLIPFLEHDDANRALMGSNMQRQAVPLMISEKPIVGTGLEFRVASDSGHIFQTKFSGYISYVSGQKVSLITKKKFFNSVSFNFIFNFYLKKLIKDFFITKNLKNSILIFSLLFTKLKKNEFDFSSTSHSKIGSNLKVEKKNHRALSYKEKNYEFKTLSKVSKNTKLIESKESFQSSFTFFTENNQKSLYKKSIKKEFLTSFEKIEKIRFSRRALDFLNKVKIYGASDEKNYYFSTKKKFICFSFQKKLYNKKSIKFFLKQNIHNYKIEFVKNFFGKLSEKNLTTFRSKIGLNLLKNHLISEDNTKKDFLNFFFKSVYFKEFTKKKPINGSSFLLLDSNLSSNRTKILKFYKLNLFYYKKNLKNRFKISQLSTNKKKEFIYKSNIFFFSKTVEETFHSKIGSNLKVEKKNHTSIFEDKVKNRVNFNKIQNNPSKKKKRFPFFDSLERENFSSSEKIISKTKLQIKYVQNPLFRTPNMRTSESSCIKFSINTSSLDKTFNLHNFVDFKKFTKFQSQEKFYKLITSVVDTKDFYSRKKNFLNCEYTIQKFHRSNQDTCLLQKPIINEGDWVQKGDIVADGVATVGGELSLGKNILIAYMPWEGYNFEDAILINERLVFDDIYTSIHIEKYEVEIRDTKFGIEQITHQIPELTYSEIFHLDKNGIAKPGTWVKEGDILVGKITPIKKKPLTPHEKLLYDIVGKEIPTNRDSSLRVPKGVHGRVIDIQILETENIPPEIAFEGPGRVHIYLAEKRRIQVGDKMAGRHGNKGIVSKILPIQDMPYLPDGTPVDMILNPLGVPSRMNVGQVFECLLGLSGFYLNQQFKIQPFDEIFGSEASRSIVYSKLYEARIKTGQKWLFTPNFPGKTILFDGRTGEYFDQSITVGQAYMLKLVHLVDEKIHARSTGPYSLVTQQPLRGRSKHGGQRLGEMEVWALEGFGAAYTLQELLTIKSDDMKGRHQVMDAILNNEPISLGTPESFKVLVKELQSLCLDVGVYIIDSSGKRKQIDVMKLS